MLEKHETKMLRGIILYNKCYGKHPNSFKELANELNTTRQSIYFVMNDKNKSLKILEAKLKDFIAKYKKGASS